MATVNEAGWKVGDILASQWGCTMTLVQFYQIAEVTPKMVKVFEIGQQHAKGLTSDGWTGYAVPDPSKLEKHNGECIVLTRKVIQNREHPYIQIHSSANAYMWDGTPQYYDHWD